MMTRTFDFSSFSFFLSSRARALAFAAFVPLGGAFLGCSSSSSGAPHPVTGGSDAAADAGSGDDAAPTMVADSGMTSGDDDSSTVQQGDGALGTKDSQAASVDGGADGAAPNQSCAPFSATGDQLTDSTTGLTWRRTLFGSGNFQQATTACTGWGGRLPTEAEVLAFIQAATPCANAVDFPAPPPGQTVWTTTPDPQNSSFYYTVYFDSGAAPEPAPSTDGAYILCVK